VTDFKQFHYVEAFQFVFLLIFDSFVFNSSFFFYTPRVKKKPVSTDDSPLSRAVSISNWLLIDVFFEVKFADEVDAKSSVKQFIKINVNLYFFIHETTTGSAGLRGPPGSSCEGSKDHILAPQNLVRTLSYICGYIRSRIGPYVATFNPSSAFIGPCHSSLSASALIFLKDPLISSTVHPRSQNVKEKKTKISVTFNYFNIFFRKSFKILTFLRREGNYSATSGIPVFYLWTKYKKFSGMTTRGSFFLVKSY
jgi:hypothetical protein